MIRFAVAILLSLTMCSSLWAAEGDDQSTIHDHLDRASQEVIALARIDVCHQLYIRQKSVIMDMPGFDDLEDNAKIALSDTLLHPFQMIMVEQMALKRVNPEWHERYPDLVQRYRDIEKELSEWMQKKGIEDLIDKQDADQGNAPDASGDDDR